MLNKVILMGRLCADPDFRQTPSGVAVCRIRLAIDRRFTNKQTGEREADFINVSCWRQQAEFVSRYFHKGSMIIVEGSLRNNDYTDQNGVKHYSMEVLADNVTYGESKSSAQENGGEYQGAYEEMNKCMLCGKCRLVCPRGINTRGVVMLIKRKLGDF